ncbi:hypothetical protein [Ponticaulis koreensis]|uniref:hypothetical protein n=1 Tax=Ponticaulis koreensis TaxID=1123045 RepID=UPI00040AC5C5|nr:hypothetical protein [Ponticaulis koreensis]
MPRKRSTRRRTGKTNRIMKLTILAALPLVTVSGLATGVSHMMSIPQMDDAFCYAQSEQAETAIFIDNSVTPGLSSPQFRDFQTAFMNAWEAAPPNTRFSVFSTGRSVAGSIARPAFEFCKPASTPAEQDAFGGPDKPAPMLSRIYDDATAHFEGTVHELISSSHDPDMQAVDSPILEQLQAISRYSGFQGPDRRLLVFTDGIQNTETARFCAVAGDMPSFETFEQQQRYTFVRPDSLDGSAVDILLIEGLITPNSLPYCSEAELRTWWPDYFRANGARTVQLTRLRTNG